MEREKRTRRRRVLVLALCLLAVGAFAAGIAVGDGSPPEDAERSADPLQPWIDAAAALSPEQLAGQRLLAGLEDVTVPATLREEIRSGGVAGVVLYADNFPSRVAGRRLIRSLQAIPRPPALRWPLLVMADQEGGLVKRIDGAPALSARGMSARGAAYSRHQGQRTARNLRDVGVNVNLAPVLDVARPGSAMAATAREWGTTPTRVAAGAIPFVEAMQAAGVAAVAKHFPGLGAARGNTDTELERIDLSKAELRRVDEPPYRDFGVAGGELVMISAAVYPAFSSKPAVFARSVVTGELRERLGFEGIAITDALDTTSALSVGGPIEAGLAAARAGADLLLYTGSEPAADVRQALVRELRRGRLERPSFARSVARVLRLRERLAGG